MKKQLLFIFFCFISFAIKAQTTYYVAANGNDNNNGTSPTTPWQTIAKVNSHTYSTGDVIAFNGGDIFYGTIIANQSGISGSPIKYTSYGTGKAIISGFTTLTNWSAYNSNIQKAALNSGGHLEMVTFNGNPIGRGRYPNAGFLHYESFVEDQSITDNQLPSSPSWTGAEIVMRKTAWTLDRDSITNQSGQTLNFTPGSTWETMSNNWGYFIQNSLQACDTLTEWYYSGGYLYMYFGANSPSSYTVKASTLDNLFTANTKNYITIDNLSFEGSDESAIDITSCQHFTINNCTLNDVGLNGVYARTGCPYLTITNSTLSNIYSQGITIGGNSNYTYIAHNTITKTNIIKGTGEHGSGANWDNLGDGIALGTNNNYQTAEFNTITYTGHMGIRFGGQNDTIRKNLVQHIGQTRMDVGAIYCWNNSNPLTGSDIESNVATNSDVDSSGNPKSDEFYGSSGIYLDYVSGVSVLKNSVGNVSGLGIQINGGQNLEIHDNNVFNCKNSALYLSERSGDQETNVNVSRNYFIEKTLPVAYYSLPYSNQGVNSATLQFYSNNTTFHDIGQVDSNYYARPIDDNITINTHMSGDANWFGNKINLAQWQSFSGKDAHSYKSPISIPDTNHIIFVYNASSTSSSIPLSYSYEDIKGTAYNSGSITLQPYTSATLLQTGSVSALANAGSDKHIYLTQGNSVSLDGSASIGSTFQWTEVSSDYKSGATIVSPTSKTTTVSGLPQGVFYFELAATANGVTSKDTVAVSVDFETPPSTGTQIEEIPISNTTFRSLVNNRDDTTNYTGYGFPNDFYPDTYGHSLYMERARSNGMTVDNQGKKLYTTIEDGYQWNNSGYARSELTYGGSVQIDSNKVYCIVWKGYYPQPDYYLEYSGVTWSAFTTILQIHGNDGQSPPFGLNVGYNGNLWVGEFVGSSFDSLTIAKYSDFYNKAHTIKVYYKESQNNGYVKVFVDGVQKYYRTGQVGRTWQQDYLKGAGVYDYGNRVVDVFNYTRNRKFSLVTEAYNVYTGTDTTNGVIIPAPTISAGANDTTALTTDTLKATYTIASGHTATFLWTKQSGPNCSIVTPNNPTTIINNLTDGDYKFVVKITQDDGQKDTDYVWVHVAQPIIVNAGTTQTIYLNSTNTATLNGSNSSGLTYQWSEITVEPTDYLSGAPITNATSKTTTVGPLPQGVFYFKLAVSNGDIVAYDTTIVKVDYAPPPTGTLIHTFNMNDANAIKAINDRHDTTSYFPVSDQTYSQYTDLASIPYDWYLFRDRLPGLKIDTMRAKLISTIQDGYQGSDGYPRAEIQPAEYKLTLDTIHTYCFEYKGYFPQNINYLTTWHQILTMFQVHSGTQSATVFGFDLDANSNIIGGDVYDDYSGVDYGKGPGLKTVNDTIGVLNDFYNHAHTIRFYIKEGRGYAGQTAFIKYYVDGVLKYSRISGQVGSSSWNDYVKFAGLYDWNSSMVNGTATTHDRKWQLVTEAFNIYQVSGISEGPTVTMSGTQNISTTQTSVSANVTWTVGHSGTGKWTQVSGPIATIVSPTSSTTTISNLSNGQSIFKYTATQDDGQTVSGTVTINTSIVVNQPPTANAGPDQTVTATSITLYGSATSPSGLTTTYSWGEISGPSSITITNGSTLSPTISNLALGKYVVRLYVTQSDGQVASDDVQIIVGSKTIIQRIIRNGTKIYRET